MAIKTLRIGTRGSALALKQADIVKDRIQKIYPALKLEVVTIVTTGDKILNKNLATIGGKGLFIKEIEEELQNGKIDLAVHSMKDMPAIMPENFTIAAVLEREDASDVLISHKYQSIAEIPDGAVIGTSSARRAAQALHLRPGLKIIPFRGNINTRLRKLDEMEADATFLAAAGINRIHLMDVSIMHIIPKIEMLPAVSQGAIGIETLKHSALLQEMLAPLNHTETFNSINTERSFMRVFEGSCTTPIAAFAEIIDNTIHLKCLISKPDGSVIHRTSRIGNIADAVAIGEDAAIELKAIAGENFFA